MRSLLACTLAVLALGVIAQDQTCVCRYDRYGGPGFGHGQAKRSIVETRLNFQEARISRIAENLKKVTDALKGGKELRDRIVFDNRDIKSRIRNLEGYDCPDDQFFCGKDERQCIGNLLVCDGRNDCENGRDESEDICYNPAQAGFSFKGNVYVKDTCTKRRPYAFTIIMTSVEKPSYFTARLKVAANVISHMRDADGERSDTLKVEGYYYPAKARLAFAPPEEDGLAIVCEFDDPRENHAHCAIIHQLSLTPCVQFTVMKQ